MRVTSPWLVVVFPEKLRLGPSQEFFDVDLGFAEVSLRSRVSEVVVQLLPPESVINRA